MLKRGQKYSAPVHDGSFNEEGNAADDPHKSHDAAWYGKECRTILFPAIGQQITHKNGQHDKHQRCGAKRCLHRSKAQAQPDAKSSCPGKAAHAPKCMEP